MQKFSDGTIVDAVVFVKINHTGPIPISLENYTFDQAKDQVKKRPRKTICETFENSHRRNVKYIQPKRGDNGLCLYVYPHEAISMIC